MNKGGRIVGMIVFVLGTVILLFVFYTAYGMFTSPPAEMFSYTGERTSQLTVTGLGSAAVSIVVRIVLLFVMTLAGSLIAYRGIQLYLASGEQRGVDESDILPDDDALQPDE